MIKADGSAVEQLKTTEVRRRAGHVMAMANVALTLRVGAAAAVLSTGSLVSLVGLQQASGSPRTSTPHRTSVVRMVRRTWSARDSADTYTANAAPHRRHGDWHKLAATDERHNHKAAFVKFRVSGLPRGVRVTRATITFTRLHHRLPTSRLRLHRVGVTGWGQQRLTASHRPAFGPTVAAAHSAGGMRQVSFSVRRDVRHNGRYGFMLTSSARHGIARFGSRESHRAPTLRLAYVFPRLDSSHPKVGSHPSGSSSGGDSGCTLTAKLVPTCGVLFGGVFDSWGGRNLMSTYTRAEAATGQHFVLDHDYRRPGQTLSPYDVSAATNAGTILQLNWKPAYSWAAASGGDATVNAQIDAMARSIRALGSHRIFLTVWHEPENDVSGDPNCPSVNDKGSAGTPTQYRAMWSNVESRFAALGVTNVVWDMNYMNYAPWNCLVNDLWPGNSLVDWVFFESYSDNTSNFSSSTSNLYNLLTKQSDADHDYLSKPWGIGEFGTDATDLAVRNSYYSSIKTALDTGEFPKLKLLSMYDSPGIGGDFRVGYTDAGHSDPASMASFLTLVKDPAIINGDATDGS